MPRAQRERQMIDVAVALFAERGYVAASMDEIAERVGVSKPMLYEYFHSKEGLLIAAIRRARADLLAATENAASSARSAEEALWQGLLAYFQFIDQRHAEWSLLRHELSLVGASAADEVEAIRRQQTEFNASLIRVYLPGVPDLEVEAVAEFLVGACERMAIWAERWDEVTPERATALTMEILWNGLGNRQGGHS
ncbi:TetR/AcrR family transcriptional regulator [Haloechinothrix sp. YIM 98757]|uniref:TetR/AcrR family transcriptional regulator n=2 Tax=Haloechinothrix aidingensis TaxID=2752311 RepID=A0A838A7E7_9PSEU|nr:TetR/AcrR family transcriptional regulator [Haloechinothrix aidingensis]MBA0125128.1 TetR/AcrR family transcriptional regulator [Haloechinothrix aidingensis]